MKSISNILLTITLLISQTSADTDASDAARTDQDSAAVAQQVASTERPDLELIDVSSVQAEIVTRSVGLFELAGLQLPPMVVRAGADPSDCSGYFAVHDKNAGWSEIVLCSQVGPLWERHQVVHELAHAWAAFELTDERRDAFQALRGWEHWRNYELAAWRDNGTEQAAEIIAWGVYDRAAPVFIHHRGCDELFDGYRTLTGTDTPQGHTALCDQRTDTVERF